MDGRWLVHLPWSAAISAMVLLVAVQGLLARPASLERARSSAQVAAEGLLHRELLAVGDHLRQGDMDALRAYVRAAAELPGVSALHVLSPEGRILVSTEPALEGAPLEALSDGGSPIPDGALDAPFELRSIREPGSNHVDLVGSVSLTGSDAGGSAQGRVYAVYDLGPAIQPVRDASWRFMLWTAVLMLVFAVPLQFAVHFLINRRLTALAKDVERFEDGARSGVFEDGLNDGIGRVSARLREATLSLAEREVAVQRLNLALESANAGVWDWYLVGNVVHTSPQYHTMFGDVPVAGPIPVGTVLDRVHPDDRDHIRAALRALGVPGQDSYDVEFRMRAAESDRYLWIRSTGRVVERGPDGRALRMLGQHVDISARRALQEREADLARIVDESLNEVYVFSAAENRFLHANRAACDNLGYSLNELTGMTPLDLKPDYTRESFDALLAPLRGGTEQQIQFETWHRRKDGSRYDVEVYLQCHTHREEPAYVAFILDITARKEQERALRASEARFRMLVDQAADAVFLIDADGVFVDVNAEACRSTGYAREELVSRTVLELIPRLSQERLVQFIASLEPGRPALIESHHRRKDGVEFPVEIRIAAYDVEGARRVIALARDISARKQDEERNRVRDARFRKLFEGVDHSICVFDRAARFVMVNHVAAGNLGHTPDEVLGQSLGAFVPELEPLARERIARVLASDSPEEWEQTVELQGVSRWFRAILQPMQDDAGENEWALLTAYDITESRRGEEQARAQEARYQTLVESTSAILWEANPDTWQFTFVNSEAETVLGYPPARWIEEHDFWPNHIHPADREWTVQTCLLATARCEPHTMEYRMIRADGGVVWLRDIVSVIAEGGRARRLVGVMVDITREKREEERFQAAFESIPIGNIVVDSRGAIQLANPAAKAMFGYANGELAGRPFSLLIPFLEGAGTDNSDLGPRAALSEVDGMEEHSGRRKNGEVFPVRLAIGEMQREGARTYVCSVIDLSHVKSLEAQLAQAQRMEAVGQLAGGVAHDFNNLLHVINGFVEIARDSLPREAPVQSELEQIALAGERAAALTSQLLSFSRRQVMKPENLDLNVVVAQTASMLGRVIGEHIRLEVLASPRLAAVYADRGMIEQVLMNLCVNARDAMPGGGVLSIETENVVIDEAYSRDHLWANPGRYVLISVTDTGCGMDRETMEHVFEPFFTTKPVHEGTGLGLSTVYGIVKQHGGMISVYSEPGRGTTFKVYLPQSERLAEDVGTKIEGQVPRGTETILIVEDDESVRRLTRAILEGAGYAVLEAADGRKAVHCFKENRAAIDLVLLDVVMPELGGREALDAMLQIDPGVKALFASGYSENAIHTNFVLDKGLALLKKPYSRNELLRMVRRILDLHSGEIGGSA